MIKGSGNQIRFTTFLDEEVSTYLTSNLVGAKLDSGAVKSLTNNNPQLISLLSINTSYDEFSASIYCYVQGYITLTFRNLKTYVDMSFEEGFNLTPYFLTVH